MKKLLLHPFLLLMLTLLSPFAQSSETIVIFRHGEKPPAGLGQLSCQGLQRSLALPRVLIERFGRPSELFAPNPSQTKADKGVFYAYIRPLATIEPTAIRLGMPVNLGFNLGDPAALVRYLLKPGFEDSTFFVAWEHHQIDAIAKLLVSEFDSELGASIAHWGDNDFDSLYKITLEGRGQSRQASFQVEHEGFDALPNECPP